MKAKVLKIPLHQIRELKLKTQFWIIHKEINKVREIKILGVIIIISFQNVKVLSKDQILIKVIIFMKILMIKMMKIIPMNH